MKKFWLIIIIICFSTVLSAQDWLDTAFGKSLGYNTKNKKEWFKGQIIKKERSGMGVLKMKDGSLYIGDFSKDKIKGFGMMLIAEDGKISNCNDCAVYVGNWQQGIKSGKGICYDKSGDVIYSGLFENDAPAERYPSKDDFLFNYFSLIEYDNGNKYLGEINDGQFNGYGVFVWEEGDLWFGNIKDGERKGVGLYLMYNGEWATLNCNGDDCVQISSSVNYKDIDASRKAATRQTFSTMMENFAAAATSTVEVSNQIQAMRSNGSSNGNIIQSNNGSSASSNSSGNKNSQDGTSNNKSKISDCGSNWRSDSRVYSDYESQLIKMRTYPEKYTNYTSDYTDIQSKMKQIRQKWEARGCLITKSQYE